MDPNGRFFLKIERPVYQIEDLDVTAKKTKSDSRTTIFSDIEDVSYKRCARRAVLSAVPSITWLSNYNWKDDLVKDIISGCTVAIMNIPQGMAYAMLANVNPVVGIYMAFFPVIIYAFLGTSRHISMGSFAVVCLMTGEIVSQYAKVNQMNASNSTNMELPMMSPKYTPEEVATAVSLMVGIFQIFMFIGRLGVISSLLSETLVSGFTAGAGVHVFTSQIKHIFGFVVGKHSGLFQNVKTYVDISTNLSSINWTATMISVIVVLVLLLNNYILKPWVSKKSIIPVPIELIVVLIGTMISKYLNLKEQPFNVTIVGNISVGIPTPKAAPIALLTPDIALNSLSIAIIAYIVSVSMALIFAKKNNYEIDPNQELLAQGAGNIVGSFFSCAPFAASLSRSAIQEAVGGKTQLTSLVSCSLLLIVLLWIGPFFETLPKCILASLIIVALQSVLFQVTTLPKIWKLSILDGIVFVVTYLTVVIVDINVGLLVGLFFSILSLLVQGMKPYTCLLSRVPGTDIYVDKSKYDHTIDPPGGKIIRYAGGINFANRGYFKDGLCNLLNIHPKKVMQQMANRSNKIYSIEIVDKVRFIVLDISGIHYLDPSGAQALKSIAEEFREINIPFYVAGTSDPVYESFKSNHLLETNLFNFFPTVHDAVLYAEYTLSINANAT